MPSTALITGSSSGLGLAFLKHYASQPDTHVIGLDTTHLPSIPDIPIPNSQPSKISSHVLDITTEDIRRVPDQLGLNRPVDLLIHSAGIRGLVPEVLEEKKDVQQAETYEVMNRATMMRTLEINTFGTFNVIQTFLPHLSPGAKVVVMSSRMGSIASNTTGGGYAYRASKAAVNAIVKSFSVDAPEVTFLLMHPGRVETGLVGWKEEGAFSVDEVLGDCVSVVEKADKEWSGRFVDRWGNDIAW